MTDSSDKSVKKETTPDPVSFSDLFQTTTVHAIPNIARSKSYILKFIWLVLFLGCLTFCVYSTVSAIIDYMKYNVLSKLESEQRFTSITFPTVTICNLALVDFSNKTNLERYLQVFIKILSYMITLLFNSSDSMQIMLAMATDYTDLAIT
jgi:hypothetical protein